MFSEDVAPSSEPIPGSSVPSHILRGAIHNDTLKVMAVHPLQHNHMSPLQQHIHLCLPNLAFFQDEHTSTHSTATAHSDLLVKARTSTGKAMLIIVPAIDARLKAISNHVESSLEQRKGMGLQPNLADRLTATRRFASQQVAKELATQTSMGNEPDALQRLPGPVAAGWGE